MLIHIYSYTYTVSTFSYVYINTFVEDGYHEGVVVKIHGDNKYDIKVIEADFVARWSQGNQYKTKIWGKKASPFSPKIYDHTAVPSKLGSSLFDDSSTLFPPSSLPNLTALDLSQCPQIYPSSKSIFSISPSSSYNVLSSSPPQSSLSLCNMNDFSLASSYIPMGGDDQDSLLLVTSISKGKLYNGNFVSGNFNDITIDSPNPYNCEFITLVD